MNYWTMALASICLWIGQSTTVYSQATQSPQSQKIQIDYDLVKDVTSARLLRFRIANNTDRYHSLDLSASYIYSGKTQTTQPKVDVELFTVVKARKLNTDLYVVFLIDGKEVHFSSNRSAIRNPVPGRLWSGERMVFSLRLEEFKKLAAAEKLAIKMDSVRFDLDDAALSALKLFADEIKRIGP
jgi:hypothetical protein